MSLKRRLYAGTDYRRTITIDELRAVAARRTPNFAFEYVEGGSESESSLNRNRAALDAIRLLPTTLVDTRGRSQQAQIFGRPAASPLIVAPTGLNGMLSRDGDLALARAAAASGIPFTLSTVSNTRLEALPEAAGGRLWMQLYVFSDRAIARAIVERAERAGYEALVFTTDANVFGNREWDRRNFRAPGKLTPRNLVDVALHPRWVKDVVIPRGIPRFENVVDFFPPEARGGKAGVHIVPRLFAPDLTWDDVRWLRSIWPRKLILKGLLTVAEAQQAAECGCDGIVVSNHGGRQLDHCVSSIDVLADIVRAVGDRMTVIADGGFRRGTDVVKALALGAHAVMVGRAALYGLAAGGEAGARHALAILAAEIDRTLGQLGCRSLADLGPRVLAPDSRPPAW